jgi:putative transposase
VEVSPELISRVTEAVMDEMRAWQARPLDPVYLVVYLDALFVNIRDKGVVRNKAVYIAVGLGPDGRKDVLGLWIQNTEGAKFWLAILTELRQEECRTSWSSAPTASRDGPTLSRPPSRRPSSRRVSCTWSGRPPDSCPGRTARRCAPTSGRSTPTWSVTDAERALTAFEAAWSKRFPMVAPDWRNRWAEITPFLAFPEEVRHAIYTTNAIEALNHHLRKTLKTRGALADEGAALKLLFLASRNARSTWGGRNRSWHQALLQFAIHFETRIPE